MKSFFAAITFTILALEINAAPKIDSLRRVDVDSIVVTSTRTPLSMKHSPVVTRVISSSAIERRATSSIENLLEKEVAGVEFHQAGYGSSLSFQGLDARYVLFMIDGERLSGETYGNIDYSRIPLSDVDRIEIVRGASSVLYGSNAMGAVVNVITRAPQKPFEAKVALRWGSSYQNNNKETLGGSASQGDISHYRNKLDMPNLRGDVSVGFKKGNFSSQTTASLNYTDAYKLKGRINQQRHYDKLNIMAPKIVNGRPIIDPTTKMPIFEVAKVVSDTTLSEGPDSRGLSISGSRTLNIRQKFDYKLSDKFRFELSGDYYDKRRYDFNTSLTDDNPMSSNSKPWAIEKYKGGGAKALMEHSPNKNNKIYLSFGADTYSRSLDSLNGTITSKQQHTLYTPRLQWSRTQRHDSRLTTGIEVLAEQLNFDLNPKGYDNRKRKSSISAFGQQELFITSPLSFVAGLRVEYNNSFGWMATPKVSAKYTFGDVSLRANYSRGYRAPSLKEMYMSLRIPIPGQITYIQGNDKLKPESNHYVSLSAEVIKAHYYISANIYGSFFRNKIDVVGHTEDAKTHLVYNNVDKSTLYGAEFMVKVKPVRNLQLSLNYNYTYRNDKVSNDQMTQYIFPSPHSGVAEARYIKGIKKFDVGATVNVRYVGAKEYSDFMPILKGRTTYYSGTYTSNMGSSTTVNMSVFSSYKKRYDLTVGIDNLLDYSPAIVAFNSLIVPPRNAYIKLALKL